MGTFPRGICNDKWRAVPRQPDADIFYVHFTGGFRGAKVDDDHWFIEPVLEDAEARSKGFLSKIQLERLIQLAEFKTIGFQSAGWSNGEWYSSWCPIIPGQTNHSRSPSNFWSSISYNLVPADRAEKLNDLQEADHAKIGKIVDNRSTVEHLAQSISLSLRSMDLAVEQIAEHYHEQLVNCLYSGDVDGQRSSNTLDQNLFAHVHSFFLQLGSARDYLAALIAHRLGMDAEHGKVDTMNALKAKIRTHHVGSDPVLDLLINKRWLVKVPGEKDLWATSGWLKQVTDLRNQIVHRRPYGSRYAERFGWAAPVWKDLGLFKYIRPIIVTENDEQDLLDVVSFHYRACTGFFFDAAQVSGLDLSIPTLTASDIRSMKINQRPRKDQ